MTKKTLRILLATTALAAVALTFTLQPAQRALASGPGGTGGINGVSLDGVVPAPGCDARAASAEGTGSVVVAGSIPGATGTNGVSLDGVAPASGCDARSASAEATGSVVVAAGGPGGTGGLNGVSLDGIDARAVCRPAMADR